MNERGELIEWRDERGFGFVRSDKGERFFVHIRAFGTIARRPEVGDQLTFRLAKGRGRDLVAADVRIIGLARPPSPAPAASEDRAARVERAQSSRALRIALAAFLLLALVYAHNGGRAPDWLMLVHGVAGLISAIAYWLDKLAAQAGRWRTAESTLHLIDFAGGIIGGLLAQAALRHKTAKPGFAAVTMLIAIGHFALLALLIFGLIDLPTIA